MTIKYSMDDEYSDCYFLDNLCNKNNMSKRLDNNTYSKLRLTQEFSKKFFIETRKSITITPVSIMKDDITNYRALTDIQLEQVKELTEAEKIDIINTFNIMFKTIGEFIK
jgi:hypothetical protein